MWTYPRALKPDWSRWACCLFGLKPSWGLQDCPLPLTQSSGFRTLLGILKDSIMMWKRFPFIDIYERGKGAIVFTWNPQIYQWHLFRQKKKKNPGLNTTEMLPVNCRRTRIWWRSRIFTHKLCDCDLRAVLCFSETKNPIFFLLYSTWVYRLCHSWKYTFFTALVDKSGWICVCDSVALSFSQFQVMPENFRSGGFSLQRFFWFFFTF